MCLCTTNHPSTCKICTRHAPTVSLRRWVMPEFSLVLFRLNLTWLYRGDSCHVSKNLYRRRINLFAIFGSLECRLCALGSENGDKPEPRGALARACHVSLKKNCLPTDTGSTHARDKTEKNFSRQRFRPEKTYWGVRLLLLRLRFDSVST